MNLKLLTAAAVLSTAIAAPAMAQDPAARAWSVRHQDQVRVYHHGFWPADVAAGVVGRAIGTAGAIATVPFRATHPYDTYAYNDGYYGYRGVACPPGTTFIGEDGRRHICQ